MKLILAILIATSVIDGTQIKQWCAEGQQCIEQGDGLGAAEYYKKCYDALGTVRSVMPLSTALYYIALFYEDSGDYAEAEKYIKRTLGIGEVLGRTGSLVLRYKEASQICLAQNKNEEALDYAQKGYELSLKDNNENVIGQSLLQIGDCYAALGQHEKTDSLYKSAVKWLYKRGKGKIYVPQAYIKLAENSLASRDTAMARFYYEHMLDSTHLGYDRLQMYTACVGLSRLLANSDPETSARYSSMADSLDFAPAVDSLGRALALCNIEFPRRERDIKLKAQQQILHITLITVLAFLLAAMFCVLMIQQHKARRREEEKNAALIRASLQIANEPIPLPEVKLTKREIQIARLAAKGKLNKEIAEELGISSGTVAAHKSSLFRKLGVGNTVELMMYLQKAGLK